MDIMLILDSTRQGLPLSEQQINELVNGYVSGAVPDYQMSAWLMAVCINSLTDSETAALTTAMKLSGKTVDLSQIEGITCDKHSTGGIGDKTSLVIAPICAACGLKVPKMSGRGLGYTGGTIDKLESIPGYRTSLSQSDFIRVVNSCGFSIISQNDGLCPADKKMYALRDVTATIESIPLISASIMSKKLAMGADCILLDVKYGSGAFMKTYELADELADSMIRAGRAAGKKTDAVLSDMNNPLGLSIGNSLEVIEAIELLKNKLRGKLFDKCIELAAAMLSLSGFGEVSLCRDSAIAAVESGKALQHLCRNIELQGGNPNVVDDYTLFPQPTHSSVICSTASGKISGIDAIQVGRAGHALGAGRQRAGESVDLSAGVVLCHEVGDVVEQGEPLMRLYSSTVSDFSQFASLADSVKLVR